MKKMINWMEKLDAGTMCCVAVVAAVVFYIL